METPGDQADVPHHCAKCDYDMQGSAGNTCPECGEAFDPAAVREAMRRSTRMGRLGWLLFMPSASLMILTPMIMWAFPEPQGGALDVFTCVALIVAGCAVFLGVKAAARFTRRELAMRPGQSPTVAFYVLTALGTVIIFSVQAGLGWLATIVGFVIGVLLGVIKIII